MLISKHLPSAKDARIYMSVERSYLGYIRLSLYTLSFAVFLRKLEIPADITQKIHVSVIHIQQNFDKKLAELLQEMNDIKARLILDLDKKMDKLSQEVENIRENLHYLKQDSGRKMAELLQEMNNIKAKDIREIREKMEKMNVGIEQLEQQTRERIERIAKLLTEPIFDEDQLKI